jgi:hypothetical protein
MQKNLNESSEPLLDPIETSRVSSHSRYSKQFKSKRELSASVTDCVP